MKKKKETVGVVGLGYVGLPLAVRAKERGYNVIGFERTKEKAELINGSTTPPIKDKYLEEKMPDYPIEATTDTSRIKECDIVLICVPTPVDELYNPDIRPVESASRTISKNLKKGALVVLESTVNPGVSEEIIKPIFEADGHEIGKDVFIAHCPERINPGDPKWDVTNLPRVVGAFTKKGTEKAVKFYENIIDAEIKPMKSIREAEACKIVENSFRDINIAFVNELAKSFDRMGIDIKNVIDGASSKFSFMPHYPSRGIGGHCIPVDPYYLIKRAKQAGFDHKFLRMSRDINNSMPIYTVELLQDCLNEAKLPLNGTKVGLLGVAYKPNVDDDRESPYYKIAAELRNHKADILTYDPYIMKRSNVESLEKLLEKSEAIILVTNHKDFDVIDGKMLKKYNIKVVVDGVNSMDKEDIKANGIIYKGIGR